MATILIIAIILIVTFPFRAIIKRDTDRDDSMKRDTNRDDSMKRDADRDDSMKRDADRDGSMKRDTDRDGSMNKSVSWEYVKATLRTMNIEPKQCPKCGLESYNLNWFEFRTSDDSWRHLAGRAGFYSKCPECNIMVHDIETLMS